MDQIQALLQDDEGCPTDDWETVKDVVKVILYISGAFVIERVLMPLFPNGLGPWESIVVIAGNVTLVIFMLRVFVNGIRCLLKTIARLVYEGNQYLKLIKLSEEHKKTPAPQPTGVPKTRRGKSTR
jgi:hypothetical protein